MRSQEYTVNNKVTRLHERCLRIVYSDSVSSFEDLLDKDRSVSVHVRNIKTLATEMFKVSNKLTVPLMNEIFVKRNNAYNLRKPSEFVRPKVHSVFHGKESISYLGPQIWDMIPVEMKNLTTMCAFKREVKNWKLENCLCRLCKPYIQNVGFISTLSIWLFLFFFFFLFIKF